MGFTTVGSICSRDAVVGIVSIDDLLDVLANELNSIARLVERQTRLPSQPAEGGG